MQLNCELCNKYSRLLPQPERFNPTSHISHELQKFPFSVVALFPTATMSFLCSFPPTLVFLFECEHFCHAICCFTYFQCRSPPPPSLLFPKALELLSLETVCTHSFFPELGPAGLRNQSVAHQRPGCSCHSHHGI